MTSTSRLGFFSSTGIFLIGIAYIAVVSFGVSKVGLSEPIADPTLAVMEVLTILSALLISGALALIGAIGPITGNMALQRIGILGYGIVLPIAAFMIAVFFWKSER